MTNQEELELFNERAAIREYDANKTREEAERLAREDVEAYRHKCEVDSIVRRFVESGPDAVKSFLELVKEKRGAETAERLRREAWDKIQARKRS